MFADRLAREVERWVAEGVISPEQGDAIRSRYRETAAGERRGRVIQMLATIGAIVAGLGVILFFAANWDAIPRPLRVALLLGAMLAAYAGGYVLRGQRWTRPRVGEALFLLGALLFGAAIFLVGQMYHVRAHDPLAFLVWTLAAGPTAAVVRSRPIAALAILTFGAWLLYELLVIGGEEDLGAYFPFAAGLYGAALYGFGTWAAKPLADSGFPGPMRAFGYVLSALGVFVFTFREVFGALDERGPLGTGLSVALAALTVLALAGAALLATRRTRAGSPWEAAALAAVTALLLAALFVPEGEDAIVLPILFNVLLAGLALGAIVVGYANEEVWLVNLGIAWVAIDVIARYVDFFWDLLPRSFVFIGAGLLILALAFVLERQRSRLLARMQRG